MADFEIELSSRAGEGATVIVGIGMGMEIRNATDKLDIQSLNITCTITCRLNTLMRSHFRRASKFTKLIFNYVF